MIKEKAAIFIDNSNIFKGIMAHTRRLQINGKLENGKSLRFRWDKMIEMLEAQDSGIDIYSRHFFASQHNTDTSKFSNRPTEEQSAQSGFYKAIQEPPLNFQLHGISLKNRMKRCGPIMTHTFRKCLEANNGNLNCGCKVNSDECKDCKVAYKEFYEKGVDVALATQLIISCSMNSTVPHRIILVSGDGDYIEAVRYVRQVLGKNVQLVSWSFALSYDLKKVANKQTIYLDDHWKQLCDERERPQTEEIATVAIEDLDTLEIQTIE